MPVLRTDDPRLGANPGAAFTSPFPSNDANLSAAFGSLLDAVATLPGEEPGGVMAALQAKAWTNAQARLMFDRVTSERAGGIRFDWIDKVASVASNGAVRGLFANVTFAPATKSSKFESSLAKVGLDVGLTALTSIPIYGQALKAAIAVGTFIASLFKKPKKTQSLVVPWQEYSRDVDEDVVNIVLAPVMANVDWSFAWLPALDWEQGFEMARTKKGGETRAWGVFGASGELVPGPGAGMMPGTERLTQVVQLAQTYDGGQSSRRDDITDVGSFWPSTSQFLTGAYSMAGKTGNPDMFKVRPSEIREAWGAYFDAMWASFADLWGRHVHPHNLYLSKLVSEFIYTRGPNETWEYAKRLNVEQLSQPYVTPDIFTSKFKPIIPGSRFRSIDKLYVLPACTRLMRRQLAALERSTVCALVRYEDVGDLPQFAAFADRGAPLSGTLNTWGAELRIKCQEMRRRLLKHPARYELAKPAGVSLSGPLIAPDVRVVDPPFAAELEATFTSHGKLAAERQPPSLLDPGAKPGPPDEPPGGGPPFPLPSPETLRRYVLPTLAGLGLVGGAAAALLLGED